MEVFVLDGGSTDESLDIIAQWRHRLAGFRSHKDDGQAAAINEGIERGRGKFVCWLNSDDWFLPGSLSRLVSFAEANPTAPMVYGQCLNYLDKIGAFSKVWVEPFNESRLATRCIISQPGTLIRRSAWQLVGGLDPSLTMTMDYDLWWRLHKTVGSPVFLGEVVAVNRVHSETKTTTQRRLHYEEAIETVRRHHGRVPLKWWLAQPYSVWLKSLLRRLQS
ncbi:Glycosyltransferase, GT2 family [Rhizobium aethiopicum]|uniref:Glycosyltransferase, GT2 family n=1 Tax=Rhizobium aethiopicum TaxID=1138170 RepID=A0A1C3Y5F9_9HYPH|nr:Glycosyltransferase, GT2 family [Rhizobium aethiopicum]